MFSGDRELFPIIIELGIKNGVIKLITDDDNKNEFDIIHTYMRVDPELSVVKDIINKYQTALELLQTI